MTSKAWTSLGYRDFSRAGEKTIAHAPRAQKPWRLDYRRRAVPKRAASLQRWTKPAVIPRRPPRCGWKLLPIRTMAFTLANNLRFITNGTPKIRPKRFNLSNWRLPLWGEGAPIRGIPFSRHDLRAWSVSSCTALRGWRKNRRRLLRRSEEHTSELQSHLNLVCR